MVFDAVNVKTLNILIKYKLFRIKDSNNIYIVKNTSSSLEAENYRLLSKSKYFPKIVKVEKNLIYFKNINAVSLLDEINNTEQKDLLNKFYKIAIKLLDAIKDIHDIGLVHKNLNYENIFYDAKQDKLYILDLEYTSGIKEKNSKNHSLDDYKGVIYFISPEQTGKVNAEFGFKSDYYSLGIIFYYLLSKTLPFYEHTLMAVVHMHLSKTPLLVDTLNNNVPKNLSLLISKMLEKEPDKRYQSISGIKSDLFKIINNESFEIAQNDYKHKLTLKHYRYGRNKIINQLEYMLKKSINNNIHFASISGYSGVGKSTVVQELQKYSSLTNGFYGESKFKQLSTSVPYYGFIKIINDYINTVFSQKFDGVNKLKTLMQNALGNEARVITDKIYNLHILLGDQPEVEKLDISNTKDRFCRLILKVINIITQNEHSVIFFIDDLQWADFATIELTRVIMSSNSIKNLFLIQAYRSNEVDSNHGYLKLLNIIQDDTEIKKFHLEALTLSDISKLVEDTLYVSDEILSKFFYSKSMGNAFYINQLIELFNNQNLFMYDNKNKIFTYDIDTLNSIELSSNVTEIATKNIEFLAEDVLEFLKILSANGNEFEHKLIEYIFPKVDVEFLIKTAQERNYLIKVKNKYKFSHDKIQESFYNLIDKKMLETIHYKIATRLVKTTDMKEYYENINVEISTHYSRAISLLTYDEKCKVVELNIQIANDYKNAIAYKDAIKYLDVGLELLNKNDINLYWDYLFLKLEILYILNSQAEINNIVDILEDLINTDKKYVELSKYMFTNNQYAIQYSSDILKKIGLNLPIKTNKFNVFIQYKYFEFYSKNINEDTILNLKELSDVRMSLCIETLYNMILSVYLSNKNLFFLYSFTMANIALKYGNNKYTAYSYALCAVYFSSVKYDFSKAKKLIDIALKVNEKYYDEKCNLRINFIVDNNLKHYLKNDTSFYVNKYELNEKLIRSGEVYYRNNNEVLHSLKSIFLSNMDLDNIHIDNDNNYNLFYDCEDYVLSKFQSYLIAFTYKLRNYNKQELLEKYKYKEKKYNIFIDRSTNVLIENISFITKAIENYLFGNFEEAFYFIKIASRDIDVQLGNFNEIMFRVFYNLIYLTQIKPSFSDKIIYKKNKKVIDIYAKYMPSNFNLYKNLLIAMENSYYKKTEKIDFYFQEALKDAQKQKSLFFEALIKESAANSFRNTSKKLSNLYFYEAYDSYKIFSAFSKMNNLALKYDIELVDNKKSDVDNKNGILNIDTDMVFLASQTLSKNIKTNDILKNMLKIILENIGANKGYIILNKGDEQLIVASVYNDKILLNENIPLSNEKNISHRVVNYINATNRNLLIDEAYTQKEYLNNTYIQSNKIKSILAMPIINNDEQKGILYCENNLISGIFSQDLIKTVSILLSQLIISLDNAFIYENMENLIEKRTEELNKTNQHINSSIKYASIIQKSLLAPSKFLQSYFSEYCLIWEPKDIVGGDIYFFNDFNDGNECLMMIIDCTGHGVAGAFVTMLVKAVEEQIVSKIGNNQMEINTAEILKEFNRKIKYILEGQNHHKSQNAGFDGGIMYYNKKKNIIKYSGACTNLYYMHNNDDNVNTVKGDRHSVGYAKSDINFEYKEHEIKTEKGMCFYLTTDGYIDQNGGENDFPYGKKKFIKNIQNNVSKSMKEQELLLMKTINDYQGTSERNDDITLLAIKI